MGSPVGSPMDPRKVSRLSSDFPQLSQRRPVPTHAARWWHSTRHWGPPLGPPERKGEGAAAGTLLRASLYPLVMTNMAIENGGLMVAEWWIYGI